MINSEALKRLLEQEPEYLIDRGSVLSSKLEEQFEVLQKATAQRSMSLLRGAAWIIFVVLLKLQNIGLLSWRGSYLDDTV